MDYLIGLDIGTSSVKGVLLTTKGKVAFAVREPFTYQKEGVKIEITPEAYLDACYSAIGKLARAAKGEIKALCASAASGNLLLLDKGMRPLTNIINWQDQRPTNEWETVLNGLDDDTIYKTVGWGFTHNSFPLAQLCYIKKHTPQLLEQSAVICMSTEYLYYKLTGKWGISLSAGTPFYLIDQVSGAYSKPILNALGIEEGKLPLIFPCGSVLGYVQEDMAEICALKAGTPIVLGSFDHPSAARGVGVLEEGQMLLSCGTSWVVFYPVQSREKALSARLLVDPFLAPSGPYGAMTSLASLSGKLQDCIGSLLGKTDMPFRMLSALAAESTPGANGLEIDPTNPPVAASVAQYPKTDVARAIMEGTVRLLKDRMDQLKQFGITATSAVMVGGPSEDPMWIHLIEVICGISVNVIHGANAGAVGAAVIAGIGVGIYKDEKS